MMKFAYLNSGSVLTGWGYAESNGADVAVEVNDDFDLEPGRWKSVGSDWIAVGDDLQTSKDAKSEEITSACLATIDGGFIYNGHRYDSDLISRTNIIGTATGVQAGIPLPDGFTWRTSDNENVAIDGQGVIALGAALLQHVNTQYAISWQLKAQVDAATTPEEVAAVSWPTTQP